LIRLKYDVYFLENPNRVNNIPYELRVEAGIKGALTKKLNGYVFPTGWNQTEEAKIKMSETKNNKNKLKWFNVLTNESVELSMKKMSQYTGLSIGTFSHVKQGRIKVTKSGWSIIK
jgi:hypothetical protein